MAAKTKVKVRKNEVLGGFTDEMGELGKNTVGAVKRDLIDGSGKAFMDQLGISLGLVSEAPKPQTEEVKTPDEKFNPEGGIIFDASKHTPAEIAEKKSRAKQEGHSSGSEAHIHHGQEVRDAGKRGMQKEKQQRRSELEQVQTELRQIVKQTSQESQAKYAPYTLTDLTREATVYQTSLLHQVLRGATMSKQQAESSNTWLAQAKGREGKRGGKKASTVNLTAVHERPTSGVNSTG